MLHRISQPCVLRLLEEIRKVVSVFLHMLILFQSYREENEEEVTEKKGPKDRQIQSFEKSRRKGDGRSNHQFFPQSELSESSDDWLRRVLASRSRFWDFVDLVFLVLFFLDRWDVVWGHEQNYVLKIKKCEEVSRGEEPIERNHSYEKKNEFGDKKHPSCDWIEDKVVCFSTDQVFYDGGLNVKQVWIFHIILEKKRC